MRIGPLDRTDTSEIVPDEVNAVPRSVDSSSLSADSFQALDSTSTGGVTNAQAAAAAAFLSQRLSEAIAQLTQELRQLPSPQNGAQVSCGLSPVTTSAPPQSAPVAAPPPPSAAATSAGPVANDPSTWNDNNAPYGVTLAGYSPQNHTNLTAADLASTDPASVSQNAKYLVYNYFLANQTQPSTNWAPAAAAALNKQYNTNIFQAIDGETLGYGDEYVHSAPNGYGMQSGTYNPSATGELFWGSTGSAAATS
jgi:hypothetical protein